MEDRALMAEFEPPPPPPPEPRFEADPPRRDVPYAPPDRRFERTPQRNAHDWTPRLASIVVLAVIVVCYVTTANRGLRPAAYPYSLIALLALAFIQWMPLERSQSGKLLIALASVGAALLWLAVSHFQW
jgi:hypothetical protein